MRKFLLLMLLAGTVLMLPVAADANPCALKGDNDKPDCGGPGGNSSDSTSLPDHLVPSAPPESPAWLPGQQHVNQGNYQPSWNLHGIYWLIEHGGGEFTDGRYIIKYKGKFNDP